MAINFNKLLYGIKKDIPLLSDEKYEDFNKIKDFEITNAIMFESAIRTDEISNLISEINEQTFTEDDLLYIHKLIKKDENEINKFYKNLNNEYQFGNINNQNTEYVHSYILTFEYEKDIKFFGENYNRALESFYKSKLDTDLIHYYSMNKYKIDFILNKYGLEFYSMFSKIYNINDFSQSFYERYMYNSINNDFKDSEIEFFSNVSIKKFKEDDYTTQNINLFQLESKLLDEDIIINYNFPKLDYSRPLINENHNLTLNINFNLPINEIVKTITLIKNEYDEKNYYKINSELYDNITRDFKFSETSMKKDLDYIKNSFYMFDTYKFIKSKIPKVSNKKMFEFIKKVNKENNYPILINDVSSFNSLILKLGLKY